jgi:hypothetical protein
MKYSRLFSPLVKEGVGGRLNLQKTPPTRRGLKTNQKYYY